MHPLTILEQAPSLSAQQDLFLEATRLEAHFTGALSVRAALGAHLSPVAYQAAKEHEQQLKATANVAWEDYETARDQWAANTSSAKAA